MVSPTDEGGATQAEPTWVWPAGHVDATAAAARLAVPKALVTVIVQLVVPAFGAGSEPVPPAAGVRLKLPALAPVQLIEALSVPLPDADQLVV